jgi:hypothetical protein
MTSSARRGGAKRSGVRGGGALLLTAFGTAAALLGVSCSTSPSPAAGLELVISAEGLTAPKDFDDIRLQVSEQSDAGEWRLLWDRDYLVPSAEATLPTTFTLFAGQTPDEVLIAVTAYQALNGHAAGQPIVQRVAQVQVPTDRMAALYLVLAKACEGQVTTGVSGEPTPKCASGESCQPATGQCGSNIIGSSMLPSYEPGDASALDSGLGLSDVGVDRAKGDAGSSRDGTSTSGDDEFGSGDDRSVPSDSAAVDPVSPGLDATVPETSLDSSTAMDSRPSTDECDVGGTTYSSGAPNPTNSCQSCQPGVSRSAFSDLTDGTSCGTGGICHTGACVSGCEIGGVYYATGGTDPSNPCQSCQPATSTGAWSSLGNGSDCGNGEVCNDGQCGTQCDIGGVIYASGATNQTNACQSCQPGTSTIDWTDLPNGTSCGAGDVCSQVSCIPGCFISGTIYAPGATSSTNPCLSCQPGTSTVGWTALSNGTSCGAGEVCSQASCISGCFISGTIYASGATSSTNPCLSCQPGTSTKAWTAVANGTSCGTGTCCSSECVDEETDDNNCGSCGTTCLITCVAGLCLL